MGDYCRAKAIRERADPHPGSRTPGTLVPAGGRAVSRQGPGRCGQQGAIPGDRRGGWRGAGPPGARLSSPPPPPHPAAPLPLCRARGFLFLLPRAVSCLSFELGCWLPHTTRSPSAGGRSPGLPSDGPVPPGGPLQAGWHRRPAEVARFLESPPPPCPPRSCPGPCVAPAQVSLGLPGSCPGLSRSGAGSEEVAVQTSSGLEALPCRGTRTGQWLVRGLEPSGNGRGVWPSGLGEHER